MGSIPLPALKLLGVLETVSLGHSRFAALHDSKASNRRIGRLKEAPALLTVHLLCAIEVQLRAVPAWGDPNFNFSNFFSKVFPETGRWDGRTEWEFLYEC